MTAMTGESIPRGGGMQTHSVQREEGRGVGRGKADGKEPPGTGTGPDWENSVWLLDRAKGSSSGH